MAAHHPRTSRARTAFRAALLTAALASTPACTSDAGADAVGLPAGGGPALPATVTATIDGDTVELRFADGHRDRARLLGIDTPETVAPDQPVDCFGPEASARTDALLPADTAVLVQRDVEARDRYGRLLVYLWRRSDGLFVNHSLVADGFARTLSIAPNDAHRIDLAAAAAQARADGAGLWARCPPEGR